MSEKKYTEDYDPYVNVIQGEKPKRGERSDCQASRLWYIPLGILIFFLGGGLCWGLFLVGGTINNAIDFSVQEISRQLDRPVGQIQAWITIFLIGGVFSIIGLFNFLTRKDEQPKESDRIIAKAKLLEQIRVLINQYPSKKVFKILLSSERILWVFDYEELPSSIYGIPVEWIGATNVDFALEIEFSKGFTQVYEAIPPMDNDYSAPLVRPMDYRK